jgi:hypothetical protein
VPPAGGNTTMLMPAIAVKSKYKIRIIVFIRGMWDCFYGIPIAY